MISELVSSLNSIKDYNFLRDNRDFRMIGAGLDFNVFEHTSYSGYVIKIPNSYIHDWMIIDYHETNDIIKESYGNLFLHYEYIHPDCKYFIQKKLVPFEEYHEKTINNHPEYEDAVNDWIVNGVHIDRKNLNIDLLLVTDSLTKFTQKDVIEDFHFGNLGVDPETQEIKIFDVGCFKK